MSRQTLVDACDACAEICSRCEVLMSGLTSFNDAPLACGACRAACEMTAVLAKAEGILFIQALRLCVNVCEWCAAECGQHADGDFMLCAELCGACRDECQRALEEQVSYMIQHD